MSTPNRATRRRKACRPLRYRIEDARVVGSLAALIGAALLMVAGAVYLGSARQDSLQRSSEERIVALSIRNLERALTTNVRDYAWWNDAVRFLRLDLNEAWADLNIGPYVRAIFGFEVAVAVTGDAQSLIGWLEGARTTAAAAVLGDKLPDLLAEARRQQSEAAPTAVHAVLAGTDGLYVAAASPVVPQPDSDLVLDSSPLVFLVFAKRLDSAFFRTLEEDFGLRRPMLVAPGAAPRGLASSRLEGPAGETVGEIAWEPWHPGRTQLVWLIPALLGSLAVFALFTRVVLGSIRRSTAVVRRSEARFRDIAEAASDWIWETDRDLRLTYVSEHFTRATGLRPRDVLGRPLHEVLELTDRDEQERQLASITAARPFRNVLCLLYPDGQETRTLRVAGKPVYDSPDRFLGYRGTATDITAETAALRQVRFLAEHDALTKLPNRLVLHDRLTAVLLRCERHHEIAAMLCIDLDRFKEVNDSLGHAAGDELLVACAERLRGCVRETDLVARVGGDEFAVLQTGIKRAGDVQALCDRILAALGEPFQVDGNETVIGASIGVGMIPGDG
ncbi:MAG TPA: diguanylate cyclase [Geminicoccaceae bacterium]|nr:diguanylate cyclase [Geminicoccaceae bacterium]